MTFSSLRWGICENSAKSLNIKTILENIFQNFSLNISAGNYPEVLGLETFELLSHQIVTMNEAFLFVKPNYINILCGRLLFINFPQENLISFDEVTSLDVVFFVVNHFFTDILFLEFTFDIFPCFFFFFIKL